jgi:hypothetical protein
VGADDVVLSGVALACGPVTAQDVGSGCTTGDPTTGILYYTGGGLTGPAPGDGPSFVAQINLNGTGNTVLVPDQRRTRGITVDEGEGLIFWNDTETFSTLSSELDGSNVQVVADWGALFGGAQGVTDIDVDRVAQKVYVGVAFSFSIFHGILSINYDGTAPTVVYAGFPDAFGGASWFIDGVDYNDDSGHLDLADIGVLSTPNRGIMLIPNATPGAAPAELLPHVNGRGRGIQVDVAAGHLFFAEHAPAFQGNGNIWRADFTPGVAPTSAADILALTSIVNNAIQRPRDIALVPSLGQVFWVDEALGTIERVDYDGSNRTLIAADIDTPDSLYIPLQVDPDGDGVGDACDLCPDTVADKPDTLNPNHWALLDPAGGQFATVSRGRGNGPGRSYTTLDTGGCSCRQIIEALGVGEGHEKHGCSISVMDTWVALVGGS